jgi:hypothetical protein
MLLCGLTRGTGTFTLLSEDVTIGFRARGLERYKGFQSLTPGFMRYAMERQPPRHPRGGWVPPTDTVRACFTEQFGEGSSRTPHDLTPTARILDVVMRRTLLPRGGYREGLTHI